MSEETPVEGRVSPSSALAVEWQIPNDMQSRYATNLVVQSGSNEFIISFFELRPPIILGSPEETQAALQQIKSIPAICVARIVVPREKMPDFVKVLNDHLERSKTTPQNLE